MLDESAAMDQAGRYWDAVARGADPSGFDLEPGLAATIDRLHQLNAAPPTAAKTRVWNAVAANVADVDRTEDGSMLQTMIADQSPLPNPVPGVKPRAAGGGSTRRTWVLAQLATAALLAVAIVGSYFAFGPGSANRGSDGPAYIPAISATPATEAAAQFIWWAEGGPDLRLKDPVNTVIDPQGNIWVIDGYNSRFQIFSPDGTFLEVWGTPGGAEGEFDFVDPGVAGGHGQAAAAFDTAGNLYVADPGNHRIQKFGPDRAFITAWGSEGREDGQFMALIGLAVDAQGRVYTSDEERSVVQVFDGDGRLLSVWGGPDAEGWLPNPAALAVAPDGNIWVVNFRQSRIQQYSPDGVLLTTWGETGNGEGEFTHPSDVAIDERGRVYVAEWGNYRVQVFDPEGRFLTTWGVIGFDEGEFYGLNGITLDGQGNFYTADDGTDRVQKFRLP
jgi:sugar lactone lactonase YvrE